jgi:hypothetical protein
VKARLALLKTPHPYIWDGSYVGNPLDGIRLTPAMTDLVAKYAFDHKTQAEIAVELKISQPAVSQRLATIRKRLGPYADRLRRGGRKVRVYPISLSFARNV